MMETDLLTDEPKPDEPDFYRQIVRNAEERFQGFGEIEAEGDKKTRNKIKRRIVEAAFEMNKGIRWIPPKAGDTSSSLEFEILNFGFLPDTPEGAMMEVYKNLGDPLEFLKTGSDLNVLRIEALDLPLMYKTVLVRERMNIVYEVIACSIKNLVRKSLQFSPERGMGLSYLIAALVKKGIYPKNPL